VAGGCRIGGKEQEPPESFTLCPEQLPSSRVLLESEMLVSVWWRPELG
jgi:hypothetical protein